MSRTIVEALKDEFWDIHLCSGWRQMFWVDGWWTVYEENQATGENEFVIETQDEKEAIEALISES